MKILYHDNGWDKLRSLSLAGRTRSPNTRPGPTERMVSVSDQNDGSVLWDRGEERPCKMDIDHRRFVDHDHVPLSIDLQR